MFQRWASDVAWGRPLPIHADQRERVTKLRDLAKRAWRWVLSLGEDDPARVRLLKHGEDLEREAARPSRSIADEGPSQAAASGARAAAGSVTARGHR